MTDVIDYCEACPNNEGRAEAIEACLKDVNEGRLVNICAGGWFRDGLSMGDFEKTLFVRHRNRREKWWEYVGPVPILVAGKRMNPGDETDPVEYDYDWN